MSDKPGIQAIDKSSVHRICSGQVILNLATAVKELVENSLDAGAKNIEVRIREHGKESIEVVDNGKGVEEHNFEGLTLKHHTSKLRDFSDLTEVGTFGFRGEALSSLCALSDVTITTRHVEAAVAHRLEFDHNGKLMKKLPCPRQQGTTVTIQQIFSTLPVRHKEFVRNVKKEFAKMVNVLTAYCLVATGVRIQCIHMNDKGKRSTVVSTNSNATVRDNITNVFGPKQIDSLCKFEQILPSEDVCEELNTSFSNTVTVPFKIEGFVSSCEHGKGRSCSDRQFIFINKRPCDLNKFTRIVNDVYHQYNRHQYPFVCLDVSLSRGDVDVNVTPDKRQIFMQNEKLLLAVVKTSLIAMYEPQSSSYQMQMFGGNSASKIVKSESNEDITENEFVKSSDVINSRDVITKPRDVMSCVNKLKRNFSSAFASRSDGGSDKRSSFSTQPKLDGFVSKRTRLYDVHATSDDDVIIQSQPTNDVITDRQEKKNGADGIKTERQFGTDVQKLDNEQFGNDVINGRICDKTSEDDDVIIERVHTVPTVTEETATPQLIFHQPNDNERCSKGQSVEVDFAGSEFEQSESMYNVEFHKISSLEEGDFKNENASGDHSSTSQRHHRSHGELNGSGDFKVEFHSVGEKSADCASVLSDPSQSRSQANFTRDEVDNKNRTPSPDVEILHDDVTIDDLKRRRSVNVNFSMKKLRQRHQSRVNEQQNKAERRFRATITPGDNTQAEDELRKQFNKQMFKDMSVLGQFNLGFIIAQLGRDLFIVDQHATDEKFNFETLQATTTLEGQRLISPQDLDLSVVNEALLLDNIEIFRKNGFEFKIDDDAPCTQKVKLISSPVSKNWLFGKSDVEEMLFMLGEAPGVMCRPSRVREMFASRACRKSVMIGTALSQKDMKKLLGHMSEMEQPWNCPHGRPTMRHLINLDMISS